MLSHRSIITLAIAVVAVAALLASFMPVNQYRIISAGIDAYEDHRPIFGQQTQSGEVSLQGTLLGAGAIMVDLRHSKALTDVQLTAANVQDGSIIAAATIPVSAIKDDIFATAFFPQPISEHSAVRLTFAAPQATEHNAIGIRIDPNSGTHISGGQEQRGQLATIVIERVTVWRYLLTNVHQYSDRLLLVGIAAAAIALLLLAPHLSRWQWLGITLAAALGIAGFVTHLAYVFGLHGVSGGDPYNYLFISQNISHLQNPFEGVKRLPGFPLLLVPNFVLHFMSDMLWMRFISMLSAVGIAIMLFLLGGELALPLSIRLLAPALLLWQKDFFWTSWRPEPYTFYALLLVTVLWLFFKLRQSRYDYAFGIVLGYAAMTRQEGFVLAAVIGILALLYYRTQLGWKGYLRAFLPALLLVAPFFIHNTIAYGNPFFTPYFEGDRLQIVNSWEMFKDSSGATWGVLSSLWKVAWDELTRVDMTTPLFLGSLAALLAWWAIRAFLPRRHIAIKLAMLALDLVLLAVVFILLFTNKALLQENILTISAAALLISAIPFVITTKWKGAVIIAVALSQIFIATWFHPFPKHFQQVYPLLMLMLAVVIGAPRLTNDSEETPVIDAFSNFALLLPLGLIILLTFGKLPPEIDKSNQGTALDHVTYKAVQLARTLPGPYGFDEAYLSARLYFEDHAWYYGDSDENLAEEEHWLAEHHIRTMVVTNANHVFRKPKANWHLIKSFKTEAKDEALVESSVYEIDQ
jgi:hypothetical protein